MQSSTAVAGAGRDAAAAPPAEHEYRARLMVLS